jgi:hypothetical protein
MDLSRIFVSRQEYEIFIALFVLYSTHCKFVPDVKKCMRLSTERETTILELEMLEM